MSETKKERTLEDVSKEYSGICTQVGHLQYQSFAFAKDIGILNGQLQTLNLEAASIQAKSNEAAKATLESTVAATIAAASQSPAEAVAKFDAEGAANEQKS